MARRKTQIEFVEEATKVHSNFYNYELVRYVNSTTNVKIICPVHGMFEQTPATHLNNRGCRDCGKLRTISAHKNDTETFIQKAKLKHGKLYDYSSVVYVGNKEKVDIRCNVYGIFKQTPNNHLTGYGCNRCGCNRTNSKNTGDSESFIKDAIRVHENLYQYDGKQHFHAVDFWGGKEGLKKQKKHDSIKTNYCNENGINLLRIRYDCNHNTVLKEFFKQQFNHDLKD